MMICIAGPLRCCAYHHAFRRSGAKEEGEEERKKRKDKGKEKAPVGRLSEGTYTTKGLTAYHAVFMIAITSRVLARDGLSTAEVHRCITVASHHLVNEVSPSLMNRWRLCEGRVTLRW